MSRQRAVDIRQDDYSRVLLTETLPVEVPLFFSNIGLYRWARSHLGGRASSQPKEPALVSSIVNKLLRSKEAWRSTRPYEYNVRVSPTKQRRLAIAHPRIQLEWIDLYQRRHPLFVHYCSRSDWSLRAPSRVASRTYVANPDRDLYKMKLDAAGVDVNSDHWRHRHAASFFSYRGYRRLYRFFDSNDFLKLEQKYPTLWMLDISNCFGSIYTHSVSWATRSKIEIKNNIKSSRNTFGGEMDMAVRCANWNETSGILVGPELSRIFAEIILQDVDLRVCRDFPSRDDFAVRRYVDDYFVFSADEIVAELVVNSIRKELARYNLHLNTSKTAKYSRPFITEKSRAIELAKVALAEFENIICRNHEVGVEPDANMNELTPDEQTARDDTIDGPKLKRVIVPRQIRSIQRLKASTLRKLKAICSENPAGYDLVGGYVFPALANLLSKLYESDAREIKNAALYARPTQLILEILYFLYSVAPSVGHSVRLANASLLSLSFFSLGTLTQEKPNVEDTIYRACANFLRESCKSRRSGAVVGLEELNIVTIMGQLGSDFEVPWNTLQAWLLPKDGHIKDLDYFALAVLIQYVRDRRDFDEARADLGNAIVEKIRKADSSTISNSAEFALIVLDFLSCPYIDESDRSALLLVTAEKLNLPKPRSGAERRDNIKWMLSNEWFSDWEDIYLYRSLQRSERVGFY